MAKATSNAIVFSYKLEDKVSKEQVVKLKVSKHSFQIAILRNDYGYSFTWKNS